MVTKFIGTKELRQNMAGITKNAQKNNERIIVMRKNKPLFELRPLSDEHALAESFRRDIAEAQMQAKKGETYTHEELLEEFGL